MLQDTNSLFSEKTLDGKRVKQQNFSGKATYMARSWKCHKLHDAIKSIGNVNEQAEVMLSVLKQPSMAEVSKTIGLKLPRMIKAAVYNHKQLKSAVQ